MEVLFLFTLICFLPLIIINSKSFFALIIITMFFDNKAFHINFDSVPFDIQPIHLVVFISFPLLIILLIDHVRKNHTITIHQYFLISFFLFALIKTIFNYNTDSFSYFGLFSIGVVLYFSFIFFLKKSDLSFLYNLLLLSGFFQLFLGLIQVILGFLTYANFYNFDFYIQHLDYVMFGRPFGTLVEPDFFGAISTFFAFLFLKEYISTKSNIYYFSFLLSFLLLFYGGVRAAIISFILSFIYLLYYFRREIKMNLKESLIIFYSLLFLSPLFFSTILRFSYLFRTEFWTEGINNPRILQLGVSFAQFLESPIFGNGLNAYMFLGDFYEDAIKIGQPNWVNQGYDPSLITSLLNDTGIFGFSIFGLFIYYYFKNLSINLNSRNIFVFCAISSFLTTFLFTNGLILHFTWVFLAFSEILFSFNTSSYD